jgi:hypothetical protein
VTCPSPGLHDLERLFDGILVELGEQPVDVGAVGGVVRCVECALGLSVRHVLDADDDVHGSDVLRVLWGVQKVVLVSSILSGRVGGDPRPSA